LSRKAEEENKGGPARIDFEKNNYRGGPTLARPTSPTSF